MINFNMLMLLAMMTKLPKLTMDIDNMKSVLRETTQYMPDDVRDFFMQAFWDKMK